jgi:N-acetylmuramic acid 6-phosphate etherase
LTVTSQTEMTHDLGRGLDQRDPLSIVQLLAAAQSASLQAVAAAAAPIAFAARLAADRLLSGGRLVYAGAGSSGLLALCDGLELPGTFGIPRSRVVILFAGAPETLSALAGDSEEDDALGRRDVAAANIGVADCMIAVSASGSTPYSLACLDAARKSGAATIAIANNAQTPLLRHADAPIHLATGPEIIAGSTRMAAGTAQKIALNILSTLVAVHLGHVVDGEMVNLQIDNAKLRQRAIRIVRRIGHVDGEVAATCLDSANGSVKHAILMAAGARTYAAAETCLEASAGYVRPALMLLQNPSR